MTDPHPTRTCPRCGAHTVEGYFLDTGFLGALALRWIDGNAGSSGAAAVRVTDHKMYRVRADRCDACGHLELFAVARDYGP